MSISQKCKIDGCNLKHHARSYCTRHYKSLVRHGDPLHVDSRRVEAANRKCKVEWCNTKANDNGGKPLTKGFCNRHYAQTLRHGNIIETNMDYRPAIIEGNIAKIPLGFKAKHGYALVDADMAHLDRYFWTITSNGYAITNPTKSTTPTRMHHLVLPRREGYIIDHINRDKLDNRRSNLRYATRSQNLHNSFNPGASGYKGVTYLKRTGTWQAVIGYKTKCFKDKREAAEYYNKLALEAYGEYAYLNEIRR